MWAGWDYIGEVGAGCAEYGDYSFGGERPETGMTGGNGRIDLSQAESVIDVIQAKNDYALPLKLNIFPRFTAISGAVATNRTQAINICPSLPTISGTIATNWAQAIRVGQRQLSIIFSCSDHF